MLMFLAGLTPASAVAGATGVGAVLTIPLFLFAGASRTDFIPYRALESGRLDWLLNAVANARFYGPRHAAPRMPFLFRLIAPKGVAR